MLPLAKQQPPDAPDAPAPADVPAPWAAPAPAGPDAARAEPPAAPPAGIGTVPAAPPPARPSSEGNGVAAVNHAPNTGVREPEATGAAGAAGAAGAGRAAAADAESVRRIPLDATRPGAGLAPEERALFHGGAVTRAKRDTGGVGARPGRAACLPCVKQFVMFTESPLSELVPKYRSLLLPCVVILLVNLDCYELARPVLLCARLPTTIDVRAPREEVQLWLRRVAALHVVEGLPCFALGGRKVSCAAQTAAAAARTAASSVHASARSAFPRLGSQATPRPPPRRLQLRLHGLRLPMCTQVPGAPCLPRVSSNPAPPAAQTTAAAAWTTASNGRASPGRRPTAPRARSPRSPAAPRPPQCPRSCRRWPRRRAWTTSGAAGSCRRPSGARSRASSTGSASGRALLLLWGSWRANCTCLQCL